MDLKTTKCKPCEGGVEKLTAEEIQELKKQIHPNWKIRDNKLISNTYSFVNYKHTMSYANKIAELAEEEGHHPDMHVYYGKIVVEIWTHAIQGLSENDFILASKIDDL